MKISILVLCTMVLGANAFATERPVNCSIWVANDLTAITQEEHNINTSARLNIPFTPGLDKDKIIKVGIEGDGSLNKPYQVKMADNASDAIASISFKSSFLAKSWSPSEHEKGIDTFEVQLPLIKIDGAYPGYNVVMLDGLASLRVNLSKLNSDVGRLFMKCDEDK